MKKWAFKSELVTVAERLVFISLFIDGVYELGENDTPPTFHATGEPTRAEVAKILEKISARTTKLLEFRGIIIEDDEQGLQIDLSDDEFSQMPAFDLD